jgi:hypothetical protein
MYQNSTFNRIVRINTDGLPDNTIFGTPNRFSIARIDNNIVEITSDNGTMLGDDELNNTPFEISVSS